MTALGSIGGMIIAARIEYQRARYRFETPSAPEPERVLTPASLPGGYSVCAPPDPIPNSAVKPDCADGTTA